MCSESFPLLCEIRRHSTLLVATMSLLFQETTFEPFYERSTLYYDVGSDLIMAVSGNYLISSCCDNHFTLY